MKHLKINNMDILEFKNTLENQVKTILGDSFQVRTFISELAGKERASVCLTIFGSNPAYGIRHNSKSHSQFWAHDCLKEDKSFEGNNYVPRELKFRKIKAKSFEQLQEKMCDFIRSRKDKFIELENN